MSVLIWIAGAMAAIGLAGAVVTWLRGGVGLPVLVSVIALALTCTALVVALDKSARDDLAAEQRILALRADRLAARALAPNSPLACLDAPAGPSVENACADSVFGRPETVASAVGYVAYQLDLLADGAALAEGKQGPGSKALQALRRSLEADRFGVVAHVLATRSACTAEQCAAFALLSDPSRIKANLKTNTFDRQIASHAKNWPAAARAQSLTKDATPEGAAKTTDSQPAVSKPLSPGYDFPSASSIPPVSIMTPEPAAPPSPPAAGGTAANPPKPPAAAGETAASPSQPPAAADGAAASPSQPPAAADGAATPPSPPPAAASRAVPLAQAGPPPLPRRRPPVVEQTTQQQPNSAPLAIAPARPATPPTSNQPAGSN